MDTADFQDILDAAAGFCGLDRENLAPDEFADLRDYANNRLRFSWNYRAWFELKRSQQRYFRAIYDNATAYTATEEVFDPETQLYYQALRSTTGNPPSLSGAENSAYWAEGADRYGGDNWESGADYEVGDKVRRQTDDRIYQCHTAHTSGASFDATKFGILTPFKRYVAFQQEGEDAIGQVIRVTDVDPEVRGDARDVRYFTTSSGVTVYEDLAYIWITFRLAAPVLKGKAFDEEAIYNEGQQVYYENRETLFAGNFYTALETTAAGDSPESEPAMWSVVEVPLRLSSFLQNGMAADWLTVNENPIIAGKHEGMAGDYLYAEALRQDEDDDARVMVYTR
jgi:hypothetical protein